MCISTCLIFRDPSLEKLKWPQFHNVTNANTMHIRLDLEILNDFYLPVATFWNSLVPKIGADFNATEAD